jgi:Protein of unknown function (DUF1488)
MIALVIANISVSRCMSQVPDGTSTVFGRAEIPFFVEASALCRIDPTVTRDEFGLLSAFDLYRDRICKAAGRVYSRRSRGSYTLTASDIH